MAIGLNDLIREETCAENYQQKIRLKKRWFSDSVAHRICWKRTTKERAELI